MSNERDQTRDTVTRAEGREPITHELKCHPGPYDATERGDKPFEFRKDDREPRFEAGDTLWLRRWDPELFEQVGEVSPARLVTVHDGYTGRECRRNVTYIIREGFGIPQGYCIMGLAPGSTEAPVVYTEEDMLQAFAAGSLNPHSPLKQAFDEWLDGRKKMDELRKSL